MAPPDTPVRSLRWCCCYCCEICVRTYVLLAVAHCEVPLLFCVLIDLKYEVSTDLESPALLSPVSNIFLSFIAKQKKKTASLQSREYVG